MQTKIFINQHSEELVAQLIRLGVKVETGTALISEQKTLTKEEYEQAVNLDTQKIPWINGNKVWTAVKTPASNIFFFVVSSWEELLNILEEIDASMYVECHQFFICVQN